MYHLKLRNDLVMTFLFALSGWLHLVSGGCEATVPAEARPARVPARGPGLAGDAARQAAQRHPGRRDGPGQDHPDHRPSGAPGLRAGRLGPPPGRRAHLGAPELGDGVQKVVPRLQDPHLLRLAQGAAREAQGSQPLFSHASSQQI